MTRISITKEDYLNAAADWVFYKMAQNPYLEIEIEPELLEIMGICEDKAAEEESRHMKVEKIRN